MPGNLAVKSKGGKSDATEYFELPILLYHRIATDGPEGLAPWRVSSQMFEQQLRYLHSNGYHTIGSDELLDAVNGDRPLRGKPVMITFDDGYQDFVDTAWPLLKKFNFIAEVFIVTDKVGETSDWDSRFGDPSPLMSWDTIVDLHREGVRFGSHLATHKRVDEISAADLRYEGLKSRITLEHRLERPIQSAALPHGVGYDHHLNALGECGYEAQFGVTERVACSRDPLMDLPRISVLGADSVATLDEKLRISRPQLTGGG